MAAIHKIEFWIGMLTPLSCFLAPLSLYFGWTDGLTIPPGHVLFSFFGYGFVPFVLAVPVAVSAGFHSSKNSSLLLITVVVTAIAFAGVQTFISFYALLFAGLFVAFYFSIPAVMAIAAIAIAILGHMNSSREKEL
jgi:hypothetical protein